MPHILAPLTDFGSQPTETNDSVIPGLIPSVLSPSEDSQFPLQSVQQLLPQVSYFIRYLWDHFSFGICGEIVKQIANLTTGYILTGGKFNSLLPLKASGNHIGFQTICFGSDFTINTRRI